MANAAYSSSTAATASLRTSERLSQGAPNSRSLQCRSCRPTATAIRGGATQSSIPVLGWERISGHCTWHGRRRRRYRHHRHSSIAHLRDHTCHTPSLLWFLPRPVPSTPMPTATSNSILELIDANGMNRLKFGCCGVYLDSKSRCTVTVCMLHCYLAC